MTQSPATTPIPVQLSEPEFAAFIFPHLSMPRRGRKCKLGYHRVFNLILWVLYTGMQWKCLPVPRAGDLRSPLIFGYEPNWTRPTMLRRFGFVASCTGQCLAS